MIIRIVSAIGGGVIDMEVSPTMTVAELKRLVAKERNIPSNLLNLVFRGRQLNPEETMQEAGIQDYDKIYLISRTEGGA